MVSGVSDKYMKNYPRTKEHCEKISKALMGHAVSKETRKKLRLANIGKKYSEETKKRKSETAKRLGIIPPYYKGFEHPSL